MDASRTETSTKLESIKAFQLTQCELFNPAA